MLYEGSDFLITVTSSLFVDRTLLIEQFIAITKPGTGLLVRTPPKYGKSTNINMMKRFFSLSVNEKGCIDNWNETSNYMLFKNNNLKIYGRRDFFNSHFGKYAVICINFEPLQRVNNHEDFIEVLRIIILRTIEQHSNINCQILDNMIKNTTFFSKILDRNTIENYSKTIFSTLANCLHNKYKKQVIVLIDNFDTFIESPLYSKNSEIFHLVINIYSDLLRSKSVERSLVTGGTLSFGSSMDILPSCVVNAGPDHGVWPYFGLTDYELFSLMKSIFPDAEQRERVIAKIVQEYSGDIMEKSDESKNIQSTQITSVWCVSQYLESEGTGSTYNYQEYSLD